MLASPILERKEIWGTVSCITKKKIVLGTSQMQSSFLSEAANFPVRSSQTPLSFHLTNYGAAARLMTIERAAGRLRPTPAIEEEVANLCLNSNNDKP